MVIPVYMGESRTELTRGHKRSARLISFENHTLRAANGVIKALKEPAIACSLGEDRGNQRAGHCPRLVGVCQVGGRDIV